MGWRTGAGLLAATAATVTALALADPDLPRAPTDLALVGGWSVCCALLVGSATALYRRWRRARTASAYWLAVVAVSGGLILTGSGVLLAVVPAAWASAASVLVMEVVVWSLWLVLIRYAVRSRTRPPRQSPLALGGVIGLGGTAVQGIAGRIDGLAIVPSGPAEPRLALVIVAIMAALMVERSPGLRRVNRYRLDLACVLGAAALVTAPGGIGRAGLGATTTVAFAILALALLCAESVDLLRATEAAAPRGHHLGGRARIVTDPAGQVHAVGPAAAGTVGDVDVDEVVGAVITSRRSTGQQIAWHASHCHVHGSPELIASAVSMLLVNAAAHSPGSRVLVVAVDEGDVVRILVCEEGPALASELIPTSRGRGARGRSATRQRVRLSTARRPALPQGANLSVTGLSGPGASFEMVLPTGRFEEPAW